MGCCVGLLAPLASAASIAIPFFSASFQMPFLYATIGLTAMGIILSYQRHRSTFFLASGISGGVLILIPFHTALDLRVFYLLVGLGLGGLLAGSWGPLIRQLFRGLVSCGKA